MTTEEKKKKVLKIIDRLKPVYPDAKIALNFDNPFQLLISTILAAQSTDVGQSGCLERTDQWLDQFRGTDYKLAGVLEGDALWYVVDERKSLDNEHLSNPKNTIENVHLWLDPANRKPNQRIDLYIPPTILSLPEHSPETLKQSLKEIYENAPSSQLRSSTLLFMVGRGDTDKPLNMISSHGVILFPSAWEIEMYLEHMRLSLMKMREAEELSPKAVFLADAYQYGIRSQAFEMVWNSEMMGFVNFYLDKMGLKRTSHWWLDGYAFILSQKAFRHSFIDVVNNFQRKVVPYQEQNS